MLYSPQLKTELITKQMSWVMMHIIMALQYQQLLSITSQPFPKPAATDVWVTQNCAVKKCLLCCLTWQLQRDLEMKLKVG